MEMAKRCVSHWPELADKLSKAFWPGPLTLVLPRAESIPGIVAAGGATVGIRWPSHPFIQAVIRECGFPLAAPSANLSSRVSPTSAEHVFKQLGGKIPLIVDGGQSQVGIESTVLDLTVSPPQILRPGMIHAESLAAVVRKHSTTNIQQSTSNVEKSGFAGETLLAQGKAVGFELARRSWASTQNSKLKIQNSKLPHRRPYKNSPGGKFRRNVSVIPHDAEAFARALYAELHRCDEAGAKLIVVEAPPDSPEWAGIADRLRRAAA